MSHPLTAQGDGKPLLAAISSEMGSSKPWKTFGVQGALAHPSGIIGLAGSGFYGERLGPEKIIQKDRDECYLQAIFRGITGIVGS